MNYLSSEVRARAIPISCQAAVPPSAILPERQAARGSVVAELHIEAVEKSLKEVHLTRSPVRHFGS